MAVDPFATFQYAATTYPYPTGYADLAAVQSRIASWDANDPAAHPTMDMVSGWLLEATANIDVALVTRGYTVPLTAAAGWTPPPGMVTWQNIGVQAWLLLRNVAASYAAHYVELARHGGTSANTDDNAQHFMELFDDFLTRLESAADVLTPFGVTGPFAPEVDPAKGTSSGSLGFMQSDSSQAEGPLFRKLMQLGSGWETTTPSSGPATGADQFEGD